MRIEELEFLESYLTDSRKQKIYKVAENRTRHLTVVLEDIYHSHNASAVIRTCDCFGIQDLHVIENEKRNRVNKGVTQGAGKWINLHHYNKEKNNTEACLSSLKEQGYLIAAATLDKTKSIKLEDLPIDKTRLALCFGCEEFGLSNIAHRMSDYNVSIPMYGFTQSFNISVTVALCLQVLRERLNNLDINWHLSEKEEKELIFEWTFKSVKNSELLLKRFRGV